MNFIKRLLRVRKIIAVCRQYRLIEFFPKSYRHWGILLFVLAPFSVPCKKSIAEGERLRLALSTLGPIFIKFGQLLSTRRDLLPLDIADALADLQDNVEPFCGTKAMEIAELALGNPIEDTFVNFDSTPLASASVAQVHTAELISGEKVVVKILRPGIKKIIISDLSVMAGLASWAKKYIPASHRFRPRELVNDYKSTIINELDLRREAANTVQLRKYWKDSELLYVPEVYMELCHQDILVMERIYGVSVSDIDALKGAGTNMKVLAERGVEIFFTQVFRDSFFHADMHPGNIFVDITDPALPRYIAIDCGIMGSLTVADQRYLAENFLAFFNRDYLMVAKLHLESGWIPAGTSEADFEASIRAVCEPIFGKPLSEISFGSFLLNLFQTAREFDMPVQPQLVLLQKTLLYVEGLGRQLYPELDLWQTAKPFLENWLKERMSPQRLFDEIKKQAPFWREKLPEIPDLIFHALKTDVKKQQLLEKQVYLLTEQISQQSSQHRKIVYGIFGTASLLLGTIIHLSISSSWTTQYGLIDSGLMLAGIAFLIASLRKA
ncbi:MAG: ubiquinone biosynthesis protein [Enterobacterales bacterium]|jgi:ubiquinone biosynthesis protein